MAHVRERPWEDLPRELGALLSPHVPALADEIVAAVVTDIPEYREGGLEETVQRMVGQALTQFVGAIGVRDSENAWPEVYRALGRAEMRAGRSLDALQAAYRLGARIAWRRIAAVGMQTSLGPETLHLLAEAIFAYIDELSAESIEGYAQERSLAAGEQQRRRQRLLTVLLDHPGDARLIEEASRLAGWAPSRRVAVVALGPNEDVGQLAVRLGDDALGGHVDGFGCLLIPDPEAPGRGGLIERALSGHRAALGPAVDLYDAQRSLLWATEALALQSRDGTDGRLVRASDHLLALALVRSGDVIDELRERRFAPLRSLPPGARARLCETLLAWLACGRSAPAAARRLHVHPQTVRYRIGRLRDLLGDELDDPDSRFELELVLRAGSAEARS